MANSLNMYEHLTNTYNRDALINVKRKKKIQKKSIEDVFFHWFSSDYEQKTISVNVVLNNFANKNALIFLYLRNIVNTERFFPKNELIYLELFCYNMLILKPIPHYLIFITEYILELLISFLKANYKLLLFFSQSFHLSLYDVIPKYLLIILLLSKWSIILYIK